MKKKLIILVLIIFPFVLIGQNDCKKFTKRYVPVNLEDALNYLECSWSKTDKDTFKNKDEFTATIELHRGYGMGLRNSWGLWRGKNKISKYFRSLGIFHPDDISNIILVSFHRKLNNKDIHIQEQIQRYKDYWDNSEKKQAEDKIKAFNEYQVGDTLDFRYTFGYISQQQNDKWMKDSCIVTGLLLEKDIAKFWIKVKLINACDDKGIISNKYDIYNKNRKKVKQKDVLEIMNVGEEKWFYFDAWSY